MGNCCSDELDRSKIAPGTRMSFQITRKDRVWGDDESRDFGLALRLSPHGDGRVWIGRVFNYAKKAGVPVDVYMESIDGVAINCTDGYLAAIQDKTSINLTVQFPGGGGFGNNKSDFGHGGGSHNQSLYGGGSGDGDNNGVSTNDPYNTTTFSFRRNNPADKFGVGLQMHGPKLVISDIIDNAKSSGCPEGVQLLAVDGTAVHSFSEYLAAINGKTSMTLTVSMAGAGSNFEGGADRRRGGAAQARTAETRSVATFSFRRSSPSDKFGVGLQMTVPHIPEAPLVISDIIGNAKSSGCPEGAYLQMVDGTPVSNFQEYLAAINGKTSITLTVLVPGGGRSSTTNAAAVSTSSIEDLSQPLY